MKKYFLKIFDLNVILGAINQSHTEGFIALLLVISFSLNHSVISLYSHTDFETVTSSCCSKTHCGSCTVVSSPNEQNSKSSNSCCSKIELGLSFRACPKINPDSTDLLIYSDKLFPIMAFENEEQLFGFFQYSILQYGYLLEGFNTNPYHPPNLKFSV